MLKRVTWAATGYAAGIASSVWAARKVKTLSKAATPKAVLNRTSRKIDHATSNVREAVAAGRLAAIERERVLREAIDRTPRKQVR